MSNVSPTDGGYQYYQRTIGDLEDELKSESKKSKKGQEERLSDLEEAYQTALRKREAELEETVRNLKENLNDTLAREREQNKEEVARIKNDTYDKFGRYQGNEADVLTMQLKEGQAGWEQKHLGDQKALKDAEEAYAQRLKELQSENTLEVEKAVQTTRNSINESNAKNRQENHSSESDFVQSIKDQYAKLTQAQVDEQVSERRKTGHALAENQLDLERQIQRLTESGSTRFDDQQKAQVEALALAVRRTSDAADDQNKLLRTQIKDLLGSESSFKQDKAKATSEAVHEYEMDWRAREKLLQETYKRDTGALKQQVKEVEEHKDFLKNLALREQELRAANQIAFQNAENHGTIRDLQDTFQKDRAQTELRIQKDREQGSQLRENQAREANQGQMKALQHQADTANETLSRTRQDYDDQIKGLEKELTFRKTSDDTSSISPAAENRLRKSVVQEYEKALNAEHTSNRRAVDSVQAEYSNRYQNLASDSAARESQLNQHHASEMHQERGTLLQHIQDAEFMKQNTLNNQEADHRRATENMNRAFALELDRQRKQHEEILEATKNDLHAKNQALRMESEFNSKMSQREYTARQNELSREYEKRIADQKSEYELALHETKAQAERAIRDQERQHRLEIESQAKLYEHRIAQEEQQLKERERAITQNYQEELDKVRKTNAMLAQRRG